MRFGIQLYSLHKEIEEQGLDSILALIARAGYDCVEYAGFYGMPPAEIKALMDKYGLEGISAHIGMNSVLDNLNYIDELGIKSVYIPGIDHNYMRDQADDMAAKIREIQAELNPRGVRLGYHNHAHEYENGEDIIWNLLQKTENFYAQIDVGWAKAAGIDPSEKMRQYGDRLGCLHVKEIKEASVAGAREPAPVVGEGAVGYAEVFKTALDMKLDLFIMEVEGMSCGAEEYLTKSCENMKRLAGVIK